MLLLLLLLLLLPLPVPLPLALPLPLPLPLPLQGREQGTLYQLQVDLQIKVRQPTSTPGRAKKKSLRKIAAFEKYSDPEPPYFNVVETRSVRRCKTKVPFCIPSVHPTWPPTLKSGGGGGRPSGLRFAQGTFFLHDPDPHQSENPTTQGHRKSPTVRAIQRV